MSVFSTKDGCTEDYLHSHLDNFCREVEISSPKYLIERCGKKGDNFIGLVYRVVIEGTKNGNPEKVHGILKLASRSAEQRNLVQSTRPFFLQEIFFFKTVVPLFTEAGVELKNVPQLLYSNDEDYNEVKKKNIFNPIYWT